MVNSFMFLFGIGVIIKFTQKKNLRGLTKMEAKEELIRNVSTEYKNLYKN